MTQRRRAVDRNPFAPLALDERLRGLDERVLADAYEDLWQRLEAVGPPGHAARYSERTKWLRVTRRAVRWETRRRRRARAL